MPGEILVEHVPEKGGNHLKVCVPFTSSSESSKASDLITQVIEKMAANAPSEGDSTNLNISNFNLQNIIPRKPFFAYTYGNDDFIVFGQLEAIPLSSSTITTLQQIIKPYTLLMPSAPLFYNSSGPISGLQIGDGIYISCKPTGSSDEETAVEYDKNCVDGLWGLKILGLADELYPGLIDHIEGWDDIIEHITKHGPISSTDTVGLNALKRAGFDIIKTEHQIMLDRKIYRIYDSGNLKFMKL